MDAFLHMLTILGYAYLELVSAIILVVVIILAVIAFLKFKLRRLK